MRENAQFQEETGMKNVISRTDGGGCCDWCASVCGTFYSIGDLPDGFWRIHRNCSCVIDYKVGKTREKIRYITNDDGSINKKVDNNLLGLNLQFFGIDQKIKKI